jgi:hypothetical protein
MASLFSSSTNSSADQIARNQKATGGSLVAESHDRHVHPSRVREAGCDAVEFRCAVKSLQRQRQVNGYILWLAYEHENS